MFAVEREGGGISAARRESVLRVELREVFP